MLTVLRHDPALSEPGTWAAHDAADGRFVVHVACPQCGRPAALDHEINAKGLVTPSLVCGHGCGYHGYGLLQDWPLHGLRPA